MHHHHLVTICLLDEPIWERNSGHVTSVCVCASCKKFTLCLRGVFSSKIKTHLQAQTVAAIAVGHQHNHVVSTPHPRISSQLGPRVFSGAFVVYFRGCPMPSQPSTGERGWWGSGGESLGQCLESWWDQPLSWRPSPPPRTGWRLPRYMTSD